MQIKTKFLFFFQNFSILIFFLSLNEKKLTIYKNGKFQKKIELKVKYLSQKDILKF